MMQIAKEDLSAAYNEFEAAKAAFGVQSMIGKTNKKKPSAYFNKRTGGFYVMQKGHNFQQHEIDAARILAQHGYHVIMQPERKDIGGVSIRISGKGGDTFPEGRIGSLWYEQFSSKLSDNNAVKNSLIHAHNKGASIAVLFCRRNPLPPNEVTHGKKRYYGQKLDNKRTVSLMIAITPKMRGKGFEVQEWDIEL